MKVERISDKPASIERGVSKNRHIKADGFGMNLELANREQREQELKNMLKNIEILGRRLSSTRSLEDAKVYKKTIQEYLTFVVKNIYVLKKEPGPFNYGVHIKIEVINQRLDEITKELLNEEKENLNLADKIEEIKGLLIDVYK